MTDAEILGVFTRILRDLLGDDGIVLSSRTERPDVPGWDSFAYVNFIVAAEAELGVRFRVADVESFRTVGDIAAAVQKQLITT
jgi:acyl carrier protein